MSHVNLQVHLGYSAQLTGVLTNLARSTETAGEVFARGSRPGWHRTDDLGRHINRLDCRPLGCGSQYRFCRIFPWVSLLSDNQWQSVTIERSAAVGCITASRAHG